MLTQALNHTNTVALALADAATMVSNKTPVPVPGPPIDPLPHPIAVNSFSFVLFLFYCAITLVVGFQIARIIYYRHNPFHYQFFFLIYCFTWGILRSVFWLLIPWTSKQETFLQGFGIQVQFWTFTLVVLFYMQMIHKIEKDWAEYRTKCFLFYVVINMLFLLGFLVLPSLNYFIPKVNEQWISAASTFFIAIMYLVLALLLTFFGWRLVYLIMTTTVQVPFLKSKSRVIVLTIILVLTFISRSIRDLLAGFKIGNISLSDPMNLPLEVQIGVFLMMFIWELIPAVIVIFLFWHIPHTSEPSRDFTPPLGVPLNSAPGTPMIGELPVESSRLVDPTFYSINSPGPLYSIQSIPSDSFVWTAASLGGPSSGRPAKFSSVPPTFNRGGKTIFKGYSTASPLTEKDESLIDSGSSG